MPTFKPLIFTTPSSQTHQAEADTQKRKLQSIYGGEIAEYTHIKDFDVCKTQLLMLLQYIAELSPALHIFSIYRNSILENLVLQETITTGLENNIKITLCAAKKSIESSLLAIENNHSKIDPGALTHYIVDQCFPGAFSNIENALSHFNQNNFSLLVYTAKKQLLFDLIITFHDLYDDVNDVLPGEEIHWGNGIYNEIAETFGCSPVKDHLISQKFDDKIVEPYLNFVKEEFTVAKFIQKLILLTPSLPEVKIDFDSYASEYPKIENFFGSINLDIQENKHLYMPYGENGAITPKQNFSVYTECIIASALETHGYVDGTHFQIKNYNLFNNDNMIVRYDENQEFQVLSDKEILCLLDENEISAKTKHQLTQQLSPDALYIKFTQSLAESEQNYYFNQLLEKNILPTNVIEELLNYFFSNIINATTLYSSHQNRLAQNIFDRFYPLSRFWIEKLANSIPPEERLKYFSLAIERENMNYFKVLYYHVSALERQMMCGRSAFHNKLKVLRAFSELGIDLNTIVERSSGNTLAHLAAIQNNAALLEVINELGVDLNIKNNTGHTPTYLAIRYGKNDILNQLCSFDKKYLDSKDNEGLTLAHIAASTGNEHVIDLLFQHNIALSAQNKNGITPAHLAATYGHEGILQKLNALKVDLNIVDHNQNTIAHIAAHKNNLSLLEKIINFGVNVNAKNKQGVTPGLLLWNCTKNQASKNKILLVYYLNKLKVNLNEIYDQANGNSIVHFAASLNIADQATRELHERKLFQMLYHAGVDLNKINFKGKPAAHIAAKNANSNVLKLLYEYKANLNLPNRKGNTIAHIAAKRYSSCLLPLIHELGIDLNLPNLQKITPVYLAAHYGHINTLMAFYKFLENNPKLKWKDILSVPYKDKHKFSLAHLAARENNCDFLNLLNQYNISREQKNNQGEVVTIPIFEEIDTLGRTCVFSAIRNNHQEAFSTLCEIGVNLNAVDKDKNTLAHVVCRSADLNGKERLKWLSLLADKGVKLDSINQKNQKPIDLIRGKKIKLIISEKIDELLKNQAVRISQESGAGAIVTTGHLADPNLPILGKRTSYELLPMYNSNAQRQNDKGVNNAADVITSPPNKRSCGRR